VRGIKASEEIRYATRVGDRVFAVNCGISVTKQNMCEACFRLQNKLRVQASRKQGQSHISKLMYKTAILKKRINCKTTLIRKTQQHKAGVSVHLKYLHKKFSDLQESELEVAVKNASLPQEMEMTMIAAARIAKAKSSKGYRH